MRNVGEKGFGSMAQSQKAPKIFHGRDNRVVCKCGVAAWVALGALRTYKWRGYGYVCGACKEKGDKEILAARIALARRKGLIP